MITVADIEHTINVTGRETVLHLMAQVARNQTMPTIHHTAISRDNPGLLSSAELVTDLADVRAAWEKVVDCHTGEVKPILPEGYIETFRQKSELDEDDRVLYLYFGDVPSGKGKRSAEFWESDLDEMYTIALESELAELGLTLRQGVNNPQDLYIEAQLCQCHREGGNHV
jgi:hypothetical protein